MSDALEQASLIMVPSGYENGTLGSLKPTDGTGDFTFSRGSDISATRVNEDGYIEKGYENTLLGSNDWAQSDSQYEITGGEVGYDGTNDAWLVNKLAAAYFSKDALVLAGVMTISFFAKAGSLDRIFVFIGGDAARFDLTNATAVTAGGNPVSQNIELVSGTTDWYRCSIVINKTSTQNFLIKPQNSSNQDVTGTIYIQDAMLNQGMVSYPYVETTTAPVAGGILEDMPRLDYSGSCPALLLEPQRTNLAPHSEYLDALTQDGNGDITSNSILSPEGLLNASKIEGQGGSAFIRARQVVSLPAAGSYCFSIFAKAGTSSNFTIIAANYTATGNTAADFVLTGSGSTTSNDATIEPVGNGWYRCCVYPIMDGVDLNGNFYVYVADDTGGIFFPSNADTLGQNLYLYGMQVEQDATYPTSYIPTYGTSQTRLVDSATASVTNTTSRTYFLDGKRLADEGVGNTSPVYYPNDNLKITFWTNNRFRFRFGGQINSYYTLVGDDFKIAISYNGTDSKIFVNGVYWMTQSSFNLGNISALSISGNEGISYNQLLLFPTALSDDECIALTTIS